MSINASNRVLSRMGARELTPAELATIGDDLDTQMPCTFEPPDFHDGECSVV